MTRPLLLQQRFSLFVTKPGQKGSRYEITNDVDNVTLEIDQDRISVLTFVLNKPEKHSQYMDAGYHIDFYGGYIDRDDYYNKERNQFNEFTYDTKTSDRYRYLFNGRVFWVKLRYGKASNTLEVICKDMSWGATSSNNLMHYCYPSKDSKRDFANKPSGVIKLSEIVKGICDEIKIESDIQISEDVEFTFKRASVQHGITDWAYLRNLAKNSGCYVWTNIDPDTGKYTLYFIDRDKAVNKQNARTEFIWLNRTDDYEFKQLSVLPDATGKTEELAKFKPNQIQIEEIEVDVNPMIAGTNVSIITDFDDNGQQTQKLVSYTEDSESIIYWELDREMVERVARTNPKEADRIMNMGPTGIPYDVFIEYYKPRPMPKGIINAIDRPFAGISVDATVLGDVNIEPFQSYPIFGIGKWSTRKSSKTLYYYLYSITHEWGSNGFETKLKFKA